MNARELALVAAYEAAKPGYLASMQQPGGLSMTAEHQAGALIRVNGSAGAALEFWSELGARLPVATRQAEQWADNVSRILKEARDQDEGR